MKKKEFCKNRIKGFLIQPPQNRFKDEESEEEIEEQEETQDEESTQEDEDFS